MTWTYNDNNELLNYNDISFEYNANGNMVKKTAGADVTNYIYNVENRLIRVEDDTGTVIAEYYYDPFGRRLWKEVDGVRTYFLYSDEGLIAEFDSSGQEIKTYGYSLSSAWTTDPLFMKQGDNYYFYNNDHLGTPQKMTAVNGSVVWGAKYTSFGQATIEPSSTITNNLRFPGQYFDQETGLHYNYFRYYHSDIGRYLRADPLTKGYDISRQEHVYTYTMNNPIVFTDPVGLATCVFDYGRWNFVSGLGYEGMLYCTFENKDPRCCDGIYSGAITGLGDKRRRTSQTKGPIPSGKWLIKNVGSLARWPDSSWLMPTGNVPRYPGRNYNDFLIHEFKTRSEGCIAAFENYSDLVYCLRKDADSVETGVAGYVTVRN